MKKNFFSYLIHQNLLFLSYIVDKNSHRSSKVKVDFLQTHQSISRNQHNLESTRSDENRGTRRTRGLFVSLRYSLLHKGKVQSADFTDFLKLTQKFLYTLQLAVSRLCLRRPVEGSTSSI